MTSSIHWILLSDMLLDENEGARSEARLCLQLDEARIAPFGWIEEGKGYREFLVPAAIVNTVNVRALDGLDFYTLGGKNRAAAKERTRRARLRGRPNGD